MRALIAEVPASQIPTLVCSEIVKLKAAAAAAKSLQLCPTLCSLTDGSPPDSAVPGIFQARVLEWVAIAFSHGGV